MTSAPGPQPARTRRLGRALLAVAASLGLAVALLAAGTAFGRTSTEPPAPAPAAAAPRPVAAGADVATRIAALQAGLRRLPADDGSWAALGLAYVEQARLTADPSLYAKADGAFAESLRLRPGNDAGLTGQASLAAARHDFTGAVALTDRALAANPYSAAALAVRVDGLTELGQYAQARDVLDRLLQLKPGVGSFTRASYARELQGDVDGAREALLRAAQVTADPADAAFAQYYLGELALGGGDLDAAAAAYDAALTADPAYLAALTGRAEVRAARGDVEGALTDLRTAAAAQPQPATLVLLGELLESAGRTDEAQQQYAVVRATQQLYAASGQVVDAELSLFEADHGDPARAVALAEQAHAARPDSVVAQDAYAWALHRAGRDAEALPLARAALRTGLRSGAYRYHLGAVEAALGQRDAARTDLTTALSLGARSPLQAPAVRALLDGLR